MTHETTTSTTAFLCSGARAALASAATVAKPPDHPDGLLISYARAEEIRAELCTKHGGTWLHHYAVAIEAEVLAQVRARGFDSVAGCREATEGEKEAAREYIHGALGVDDVTVDACAAAAEGDAGVWVAAWVYVSNADVGA